MDKTITANFDSIDMATFAAKNVTSRFGNVKSIRVSYHNEERSYDETPYIFSSFFTPAGIPTTPLMNGPFPDLFNGNAFREKRQNADHSVATTKATVRITASDENIGGITSTLLTGGGLNVRVN